jgi:hypothetical protein
MMRRLPLFALALAIVMSAGAAGAQPSDADRATARALAQEGQDALDAKDYRKAADRFGRAFALFPAPTLTLGLARAQRGMGKWLAAQTTYLRVINEKLPADAPAVYAQAIADADAELAALDALVPGVVLVVEGAPEARVTVDGEPVPRAALGVRRPTDPGSHVIRAEADGFVPAQVTVTLAERATETVTLRLTSSAAQPGPPPPPSSAAAVQRALGLTGMGVGGLGLLLGGVMGGVAVGKHDTLAALCPMGHCTGQQGAIDGYHTIASLATAGLVSGGILAAAGVALFVTAPRTPGPKGARIEPVLGLGYAGLRGTF